VYNKISTTFLAVLVFCISTSVLAEQKIASDSMLANTCSGCHGNTGVSTGPGIPSIRGLSKDYFVEIMMAYKEDKAYSTIMGRIAKGYSEKEIEAMADVYANKPFVMANQKFDAGLAKKGKKIHKKYCERCHEEGGADSGDGGVLAGQWIPYLQWTIDDFNEGRRDAEKKMLKNLKKVTKKDKTGIDALLNYYASQNK
jgi:sulfide dehydrogenase cytochrome subunit